MRVPLGESMVVYFTAEGEWLSNSAEKRSPRCRLGSRRYAEEEESRSLTSFVMTGFCFFWRLEGLSGEDSSGAEARWSIGLMSELKLRPPKEQRLLLAGRVR
jgi:hypothetical protein